MNLGEGTPVNFWVGIGIGYVTLVLLTPPHLRRVGHTPGGEVGCGRDDDLRLAYVCYSHSLSPSASVNPFLNCDKEVSVTNHPGRLFQSRTTLCVKNRVRAST